jgi:hypothetical protein
MTESGSMIYRVVPKCACSSIGQIMYYSDHGVFYEGDIHDAKDGILKWGQEGARDQIRSSVLGGKQIRFTCVRNPYTRILSSFFDKVAGVQRNGKRYRGKPFQEILEGYGIHVGSPENNFQFDQVLMFRRFLLLARDTILQKQPIKPDIHWVSITTHMARFSRNGGFYDHIFPSEAFNDGMNIVLSRSDTRFPINLEEVPRFNESSGHGPARAHSIGDFFDDFSMHLVWSIYKNDFRLFGYDFHHPGNPKPIRDIDLDKVNAKLNRNKVI